MNRNQKPNKKEEIPWGCGVPDVKDKKFQIEGIFSIWLINPVSFYDKPALKFFSAGSWHKSQYRLPAWLTLPFFPTLLPDKPLSGFDHQVCEIFACILGVLICIENIRSAIFADAALQGIHAKIVLDFKVVSDDYVYAIAALVMVMSVGYWLVVRQVDAQSVSSQEAEPCIDLKRGTKT
jgi:hypothetical protein